MVKVGDNIEVSNGTKGRVTHLLEGEDGRFTIYYRDKKHKYYFIEGDVDYEVVK